MDEDQRWRLLSAAAEALAERGYARTRVADIVSRVRVSRGVIYEYFDDVPDCLLAAHEMVGDCILDLVSSACEEGQGWSAGLRLALDGVLEFLATEPSFAHLLGPEAAAAVPAIASARERLVRKLADFGADRHAVEGAMLFVADRVAAGAAADVPALARQLVELIRPAAGGPERPPRGAPAT